MGSNYYLNWELFYWDNNFASVQSDNVSFSPAFTSMTVAMEAINGLADGTYQFERLCPNATGHPLDLAVTLVMVGNSTVPSLHSSGCPPENRARRPKPNVALDTRSKR